VIYVPKRNQQLAQVFQALRIEVNKELEAIELMLPQLIEIVALKGRIVLMSYHSLEDRLVKNFIRSSRLDGEVQKDFFGSPQLYFKKIGKPIEASEDEVSMNSRARSAVLRVAERVEPKTMTS
jgi:16S rRNA (cytosine1402-N4)-methyltransferase